MGFSEQKVYLFNSVTQIAQVAVILFMTFFSGKIRKVKLITGLSYLSLGFLALILLLGAIRPEIAGNTYVIAVFVATVISNCGVGVYTVMSYCLPYYIIDMRDYGKVAGLGTITSGIISFALSMLYTFLVAKLDYMNIMICMFGLSIVCFLLSSRICMSLKEIETQERFASVNKKDLFEVFKNKDTYVLLFPNFARGLATGIVSVITVIAISRNILDEKTSAYVNIMMQIGSFSGNALFVAFYKKATSAVMLLISTIGYCVIFPFCISGGLVSFLILFLIFYIFRMIIDTSIPVLVTEIIPQNQIGAYTSVRMLIFILGQAVATLIISPLVGFIGYTGLLIFSSVMQLVCGGAYFLVSRKNKIQYDISSVAKD